MKSCHFVDTNLLSQKTQIRNIRKSSLTQVLWNLYSDDIDVITELVMSTCCQYLVEKVVTFSILIVTKFFEE